MRALTGLLGRLSIDRVKSHIWRPVGAITVTALLAATACSSAESAGRQGGAGGIVLGKVSKTDWPTFNRTSERSGVSVSSPPMGKVRPSWTKKVDAAAYAQPLIVGSDVIVATENNTVYVLNAANGKVRWSHHLASPVTHGLPCGNVLPSGITGTPTADPAHAVGTRPQDRAHDRPASHRRPGQRPARRTGARGTGAAWITRIRAVRRA